MSTLSLLPLSLLESEGVAILQQAADAALGPGVLTVTSDSNGISTGLKLSSGQTVNIDDVTIGSGGLSGRIFVDGLDANPLSATLFDGFTIALTAFDVTLAHGGLAQSHIGGRFTVPFFTDPSGNPETVDVELGFKSDGSFSLSLAAVETHQSTTPDGLVQLKYALPGGLGSVELDVASFELDRAPDGSFKIVISGNLIMETEGLQWPTFELRGLGIDSKGHVSLDGGWIDLPSQCSLDFFGFHVALQKLGMGSDADGKWIGFNGDIHLVEGLSLGGSVRGLKINLTTGALSFDGVGISFSIPGVLTIDGEIDHIHVDGSSRQSFKDAGLLPTVYDVTDPKNSPPGTVKHVDVFAGMVKVVVEAAGGLEVDANFIVGNFGGQSVFFLDIDAELPVGIPLFLDVSLYGLQGLVASGLQPEPEPDHTWWEWYKYAAGPDLSQVDYSATDVNKWLVPKDGAFAIGAGATIGTSVDDGFTVSAAIMLILELPGPVISLIGKANILSKRLGGASEDANFEAMATFDGNSGTFDLTIDAHYQIPIVLDIEATAELYVDAKQKQWFFALGLPPHDKRVKARIFDIFETDAYFVVSNSGLITGTWTGYKNSWSFGPLSASIDAYLATLVAIQWSPLQVSGGIELHGDIHLSAFGIGIGLTADALLEGCAPSPFWIHGEISVEIDLPWPLPSPSATISLTWGGDDGSIPPAPLALSHIDATLIDHTDANDRPATDHYVLLAHRPGGPMPDLPVQYDSPGTLAMPDKPGILNLTGDSLTNWQNRVNGIAPENILPDLNPNAPPPAAGKPLPIAPVVPQDAHFTLSFAHPVVDGIGFVNLTTTLPAELVTASTPSIVPADDMSNIDPQPPSVQFEILHKLSEVSLYEYDGSAWNLVCHATPLPAPGDPPPSVGPTFMNGVWVVPPPTKQDPRQVQIQLKVFPWQLLPGQDLSAQWSSQTAQKTYATSFTDQGLHFGTSGFDAVTIDGINFGGIVPGLFFEPDFKHTSYSVTITFPQAMVVTSIVALTYTRDGEFTDIFSPNCTGDGAVLTPLSSSQDATTQAFTLNFDSGGKPIRELTLSSGSFLLLYSIQYTSAPVPMAILPDPQSLYAIKSVTHVQAGRFNGGTPDYQDVHPGNPIVEFAYFQTATGPGTAEIADKAPPVPPLPAGPATYPLLSTNCGDGQTQASFPLAGSLGDLTTYTQWSWPLDGSLAAYYGYDLNVEFVESYVNALYTAFSSGSVANSLHFRCTDRNHNHTLLLPLAIHVPSIPQQSALVAETVALPLPQIISPPSTIGRVNLTRAQEAGLQKRSAVALDVVKAKLQSDVLPDSAHQINPAVLAANAVISARGGDSVITTLNPITAAELLHLAEEQAAAAAATQLWFRPLYPKTRYTLDVVAGPLLRGRGRDFTSKQTGSAGSLAAVLSATDAISLLAALKAYFAYEDALTTLERVQFTTSRYKIFTDQMANATGQLTGVATATPLRHYATAISAQDWVDTSAGIATYQTARRNYLVAVRKLNDLVAIFDPLADNLLASAGLSGSGAGDLVVDRAATTQTWSLFQQASSAIFDGLIAALGLPQLASGQKPSAVPDTEISLITNTSGNTIEALLIESPEPLPWLRIWQWIHLTPASPFAGGLRELFIAWNVDGTRGLIVPTGQPHGLYTLGIDFQGNVGAQAPSITLAGVAVAETATLGPIPLGPIRRRFPVRGEVPIERIG